LGWRGSENHRVNGEKNRATNLQISFSHVPFTKRCMNLKVVDITKHELVPKHELLTEQEKEQLLKQYGITLKQLPRILQSDPMAKVLNAKVGDVIKITRKSETAGESVYYRVVVK
jgi:DNA-directed RNA polymerase subunit H